MNITFFGGPNFHSKSPHYSPHRSTLRYPQTSKANLYKFSPRESGELHAEMRFKQSMNNIKREGRFKYGRQQPNIKIIMPQEEEDEQGPDEFIAKPSDDIPRNNLTDCLTRGLQSLI